MTRAGGGVILYNSFEFLKKTGGNLSLTQKLLGHEDISTTTIYAEATEEEIRNARNLF